MAGLDVSGGFLSNVFAIEDWPRRAPICRRRRNVHECVIENRENPAWHEDVETSRTARVCLAMFNECAIKLIPQCNIPASELTDYGVLQCPSE